MADDLISVTPWEPTDPQRKAASYIAGGYTYQRTADAVGRDPATIQRWMSTPAFREYVEDLREELRDTQEPQFQRSIDLAQQIVIGALNGEYRADDARVLLAERILARTLHRVVAIQARGSGRNVPEEPLGLPYNRTGGDAA